MSIQSITNSLLAISFVIMCACSSEKEEQKALFDEVMLLHDEVMPKMGSLRALAGQLSQNADSLALDTLSDNGTQVNEMRELSKKLKDANEGMMEWMRQFEQAEEGTPHGEVIQYLTEQRRQIQKVKEDMINSEAVAKKYLSEGN
ncbi:MAG: hypothetical protein ABJF04_03580 [Reichenbachiella sp.]|uniref:hypothetical protein n=1 Tax=Reichenbachiella sp. TaxID=2184521 RepID=UPI0032654E44